MPSRKIGEKSVEIFLANIHRRQTSFIDVIKDIGEITDLTPQARKGIASFGALYEELNQYLGEHSIPETMEFIIKRTAYKDYLESEYGE